MQAQIHLDDTLLSQAQALSGVQDYDVLLHALFAFIQQKSAKQLAKLAGNQPDLNPIPRQHHDIESYR